MIGGPAANAKNPSVSRTALPDIECPPEWMLLRPRRDFERLLNPHALGSEDALLEAKEVAEAEA